MRHCQIFAIAIAFTLGALAASCGDPEPNPGTVTDAPDASETPDGTDGEVDEDVPDEGEIDEDEDGDDGSDVPDVPDEGEVDDDIPDDGPDVCTPACQGKTCGDDGCEGSCGDCPGCNGPNDGLCEDGVCYPTCCPQCAGVQCGADGCGGICGECTAGSACVGGLCVSDCATSPTCECVAEACGLGGSFGPPEELCMIIGEFAEATGGCMNIMLDAYSGPESCTADCDKAPIPGLATLCEDPSCGLLVDLLSDFGGLSNNACLMCYCEPDCTGKSCGSDGCGGSCGSCGPAQLCKEGGCETSACLEMVSACPPKVFPGEILCDIAEPACLTVLEGDFLETKACGTCPLLPFAGLKAACEHPACIKLKDLLWELTGEPICETCFCEPECAGKECGEDGCGGSCGTCEEGTYCTGSACIVDGDALCVDMAVCQGDCDADDSICSVDCKLDAMFSELPKIEAYEGCLGECQTLPPAQIPGCVANDSGCFSAYFGCLSTATGELGCFESYYCMATCPMEDPACFADCFDDSKGQGASKLAMKVHACVTEECDVDYDDACGTAALEGACSGIWGSCNGEGACTNDADLAIVGEPSFTEQLTECGLSCLGLPSDCVVGCLSKGTGVSEACAGCHGEIFFCVINSCLGECLGGDEEGCIACAEAAGCNGSFTECSGLPPIPIGPGFGPPPPPPPPSP